MCDTELIAAILGEFRYFDEKEEGNEKDKLHHEESDKRNSKNGGREEKYFKSIVNCRLDPFAFKGLRPL
jgi:hypothetical protein